MRRAELSQMINYNHHHMVGFCHLTDSHHYHHGQKPTMVGICHGGNMPVGQYMLIAFGENLYFSLVPENPSCVTFPLPFCPLIIKTKLPPGVP